MSESKIVHFTRRERFSAAHKLWNPNWDSEKNHAVYGKCAHENWHGHNYILFVTVKGVPDDDTGMVIDLRDLKDIVKEKVISKCDHKNLTLDVDFLTGKISTAENVVIAIWDQIVGPLKEKGVDLHRVKLVETENNIADYYG
ncbi:MAG: 6-pyruvoyltetrahydropterin/6-carboxytetrahydropterin synthase [Patiriisocius sp.]|jgi:6-pyruvoyltetrahydropterin/6-carboxytetrahydropterin synthase